MSSELRSAISILPEEEQEKLYAGATAEECAEALSDYATKLEAERDALRAEIEQLKNPWISVEDRLPKEGEIVHIYCANHPRKYDEDYSAYKDGSDRTPEKLRDREYARAWYKDHPIKKGSVYMTAISGLSWRMRGGATDSKYGFFGSNRVVTHWMPLPKLEGQG
jgi:hypothetical protein